MIGLKILKCLLILLVLFLGLTISLTLPLRWVNPGVTAFVLADRNIELLNLRDKWASYDKIAPQVFLAIIAAEDQKFPNHFGFDFESLKKALLEKRAKPRGASTITQQLAKNIYLWSGRSILRKVIEAWLTLWLEIFLSKERILELYVNVVEFGPGVYGIGQAAEKFYRLSPGQISLIQASTLAAVLPSPKRYSVVAPTAYVYQRAKNIRASMKALGGVGYLKGL